MKDELVRLNKIVEKQRELLETYQESYSSTPLRMKRVWSKGVRGGGGRWDVWAVQLICELLVIGVPCPAIPKTIEAMYETLYHMAPEEIPSVNFVRQCRTIVQIAGEEMVAMALADHATWDQFFHDATTRRHCAFETLIVGCLSEDYEMETIIVSSCIFLDDESSEGVVEALFAKVRSHICCCTFSLSLL